MNKRIWELDAFRGLCIIGVVIVHFVYDLVELYGIIDWKYPAWFSFIKQWGGILFLLLSGTCATLGSRSVRRGLIVFTCGLVISAVTAGMYWLGMADKGIIIWFGVLHCLGVCMLLWPVFRDAPLWLLALLLRLLCLRLWLLAWLLLLLFLLRLNLWLLGLRLNLLLPVHRLYRLLHLCCHLLLCCSLRLRLCTRLAVSLHCLHHQLPGCIINSA